MRSKFFESKRDRIIAGKGCVAGEVYAITQANLPEILVLADLGEIRLYETKPDFTRKPEVTVEDAPVEAKLGKKPAKKKGEEGNAL